jgi:hypothetical protein
MILPMTAISFDSNYEQIELVIYEVFGFPKNTSIDGGYDVKGTIKIVSSSYSVYHDNFFFSTGGLHRLYKDLSKCYTDIAGEAVYRTFEDDFNMTFTFNRNTGHVTITGRYRQYWHLNNEIIFEIHTDQTQVLRLLEQLKAIENTFQIYEK